jgi:hypothetical protein
MSVGSAGRSAGLLRPIVEGIDEAVPAGGAISATVRISPLRMAEPVNAQWAEVAQ